MTGALNHSIALPADIALAPIPDKVAGFELPAPSVFSGAVDTDLTVGDFDFSLVPILHGLGQLQKLPESNRVAFNMNDRLCHGYVPPVSLDKVFSGASVLQ